MAELRFKKQEDTLTICLEGHISSANAPDIEAAVLQILKENPAGSLVLDCEKLEYISSAGLRVLLRLKKSIPDMTLIQVSPDVYEIFEMTGFCEILTVRKGYRMVSLDGCPVIGKGANGEVRRLNPEIVVKMYRDADALPEIRRERELARTAFVLGIPTAIPYDIVRIQGGGYGSVFELLNAESLADVLIRQEKSVEEIARISIQLLKLIHSTLPKEGTVPAILPQILKRIRVLESWLPEESYQKLLRLLTDLPEDPHMLHGDFHLKNIMLQEEEALLIDMDSLCHGQPVFELAAMYNSYRGFPDLEHRFIKTFLGLPYQTSCDFWKRSLSLYLETEDQERIREVEEKAKIIGIARIMSRSVRKGEGSEESRRIIEECRQLLIPLLQKTDSLLF